MRKLLDLLFNTTIAEFASDYPLAESVRRLSATTSGLSQALFTQTILGTVSENKVSLQHFIPFFGNSFKPFFIGKFHVIDGKVYLRGRFTLHPFFQGWMMLMYAMAISFFVLSLLLANRTWYLPLLLLGMIGVVFLFQRFCQWISRNDIPWLAERITQALTQ